MLSVDGRSVVVYTQLKKHHVRSLSYFQVRKKARSEKWVASVYAKRRSRLHVPQVFTGTYGRVEQDCWLTAGIIQGF